MVECPLCPRIHPNHRALAKHLIQRHGEVLSMENFRVHSVFRCGCGGSFKHHLQLFGHICRVNREEGGLKQHLILSNLKEM